MPENAGSETARRVIEAALAGWFTVTVLSQHPNVTFDRLRQYDRLGMLIPNWRFFAPRPSRHDYHLLFRTLSTSGEQSEWRPASRLDGRTWSQAVWFPRRRESKAVFDLCSELAVHVGERGEHVLGSVPFRLLRDFVLRHLQDSDPSWPELSGCQFLIVQYSGHDHSEDPTYLFTSQFIPVAGQEPTPHPAGEWPELPEPQHEKAP
ncbi:hypothetical protein [Streptomyces sp. NEAU-L66]|uniref:hypothetical protein n=1 Tax=Streptomyces sp. NEAU-L66 TaxID=3390812 RepID=UPI0039C68575